MCERLINKHNAAKVLYNATELFWMFVYVVFSIAWSQRFSTFYDKWLGSGSNSLEWQRLFIMQWVFNKLSQPGLEKQHQITNIIIWIGSSLELTGVD